MWIRVAALVFIFMSRIRFPAQTSIAEVIRNRYGNTTLKSFRRLEKLDVKYRKTLLDITFLNNCISNNVIPRFLYFKLANRNLRSSVAYRKCQLQLLYEEIKHKTVLSNRLLKESNSLKASLKDSVRYIDFAHICTLFLASNDRIISGSQERQVNKLHRLIEKQGVNCNNPDKVIFNFSDHTLNDAERTVLSKGLNFSVPPSKVEHSNYLAQFELLANEVNKLKVTIDEKNILFANLKETGLSSLNSYNNKPTENNLSSAEFNALLKLSKRNDLVIQKSDKGNNVVIIPKHIYIKK